MLQASPIKFSLELALANFESLKSRKDNHTFSLSLFFQAWLVTASKVMRGLLQRPQLQRGTSRTSTRTLRRRSICTTGLGRAGTRATRGTSWTFGDQLNPISLSPPCASVGLGDSQGSSTVMPLFAWILLLSVFATPGVDFAFPNHKMVPALAIGQLVILNMQWLW